MTTIKNPFQKTLLYNLIVFNFILLESSTKKISNFFLERFAANNIQKKILRLPTSELLVAFKRMLRSFYFLKKNKKKSLISFFCAESTAELLKFLFAKYKLGCFISLNPTRVVDSSTFLKKFVFLEYSLSKAKILAFFFQKSYLFQAVNAFEDSVHFSMYKIFSMLDDQKKLIFLGLILVSIFKK